MKRFIRGFLEKGLLELHNGLQKMSYLKIGLRRSNFLVYGAQGKVSLILDI